MVCVDEYGENIGTLRNLFRDSQQAIVFAKQIIELADEEYTCILEVTPAEIEFDQIKIAMRLLEFLLIFVKIEVKYRVLDWLVSNVTNHPTYYFSLSCCSR